VNGVRYFDCTDNHGLFVKKAQVSFHRYGGISDCDRMMLQVRVEREPSRLEQLRARRSGSSAPSLRTEDEDTGSVKDDSSSETSASTPMRPASGRNEGPLSATRADAHIGQPSPQAKPLRAPSPGLSRITLELRNSKDSVKQLEDTLRAKETELASANESVQLLQHTIQRLESKTSRPRSLTPDRKSVGAAASTDELQAQIEVLKKELTEQNAHVEREKQRSASIEEENGNLRTQLLGVETALRVLQAKESNAYDKEMERNSVAAKEQASIAAAKRRVEELEAQIAAGNDTLELLTLDKEQLALEQEMLQDRVAVCVIDVYRVLCATNSSSQELEAEVETLKLQAEVNAAGPADGQPKDVQLHEQNEKLKEALRRLRDVSLKEQEEMRLKIRTLEKAADELSAAKTQLEELRSWKDSSSQRLLALQEAVDESKGYQHMLERLTERNLELSEKVSQHDVTIADLEAAQEVYEELDSRQKEEIQIMRRELEDKETALRKSHDALKVQDKQVHELRTNLQRCRGIIERLTRENEELQNQASEDSERFEQALGQAKSAMSTKQLLRLANERALNFEVESMLSLIEKRVHEVRADRMGSIATIDSITQEMQVCTAESTIAQAVDLAICAFSLLTRSSNTSEVESYFEVLPRCIVEAELAILLLQSVHAGRCAMFLVSRVIVSDPGSGFSPESVALSLSACFRRVAYCLSALIKVLTTGTLSSSPGNAVVQDLQSVVQSFMSYEPLSNAVKTTRSSMHGYLVVLQMALSIWTSCTYAEQLSTVLSSLLRATNIPTESKETLTLAYHTLTTLNTDLGRWLSDCTSKDLMLTVYEAEFS
jgi:hypothetical protein